MRLSVLASSSKGNCSVVSAGDTHILVDAGISARNICKGVKECGLEIEDIRGILITHEHGDHVRGLDTLGKKLGKNMHIYCSRYLRGDLKERVPQAGFSYVEPGTVFSIGELTITPLAVNHDAIDPMGFIIEGDGVRLGYITDTGKTTRGLIDALQGLNALLVESNYDETMLRRSGRPADLIARIKGQWGHLSNTQAGELVEAVAHKDLRHVFLAHISPECNTPDVAAASMRRHLDAVSDTCTPQLHITHRDAILPWTNI